MEYINFVIYALLAGALFSAIAAPLGCFVMWNRLAYYSDAVSHASILGVSLSILLAFDPTIGVIIFSVLFALTVYALKEDILPIDNVIGVVSCLSISIAVILISITNMRVDLMGYLFGDILLVTKNEIFYLFILAVIFYSWLVKNWHKLLIFFINKDIALAEKINIKTLKLYLMVIIAVSIAISIKILGVLLVTALLILPAITARQIANAPSKMAVWSGLFTFTAIILGIMSSIAFDVPTGAVIVCISFVLYISVKIILLFINNK
jgi:zinc transport system permease protein